MANKFYAVKKGKKIGVFTTWDMCQKQVSGYPNAQFKKFTSREAANNYLKNELQDDVKQLFLNDDYEAIAYTDGSFNAELQQFSYGLVYIKNGKKSTFYEKFNDKNWVKLQNVAGEIMGAQKAMQIARKEKVASLLICHDYHGISKWCTGEWQTTKVQTKAYKDFYEKTAQEVTIAFKWVKGHSADVLNDEADYLAAKAFTLNKISKPII